MRHKPKFPAENPMYRTNNILESIEQSIERIAQALEDIRDRTPIQ